MAGLVDIYLVYQVLKKLATPFDKWDAYEQGVIDERGNILVSPKERNDKQGDSFGKMDLMVLKLKKLLEKVPGGKTKLASYAAALWLIKEHQEKGTETLTEDTLYSYMELVEEMSVGAGVVDGIGVGSKGEPGLTPKQMDQYKKENRKQQLKRYKDMWSK